MLLRLTSVSFVLWCLIPMTAWGQDAITGISIDVHATMQHAGITVVVSGDDNGDATAGLEVAVDGGAFAPAHPLSRPADDRFVGAAFELPQGTAFEVRVTLDDADGVTDGVLTASGTTRTEDVPESTGDTWWVDPAGDDGADGSSGSPFASIARGVQAAQSGDTVSINPGTYHEEITLTQGGAEGSPITITAAGGDVILDGADPALKDAAAWTDEGGNVYSASSAETRYVAVDGVRLWRYESREDLENLSLGTDGGFWYGQGQVYVRLPGDAAPAGHEIQVSALGRAFWLEGAPHVVIRDLIIRCYGSETYSEGIMVRDGSHGVWIVGNTFENVMPGIWVKNEVDDLTVMDNEFSDRGLPGFPWQAVKDQGGMESGAIGVDDQYDGQGIVFYRNRVNHSFDGLRICGDEVMDHPNNADVVANVIEHLGDDGIETDGMCSNVRIVGNRFDNALVGVSVAPAVGGPTYVVRNLMVDLNNVAPGSEWMVRAMKFNVGDDRPSGDIFAYHNTAVTYEADQASFGVTDDSRWVGVRLLNNIWTGTDRAFYYSNSGDEPFTEDYDLLFSTGDRLVYYQGGNYDTIADYHAATGQCEHCLSADPLFVDGSGGDYSLQEGSPAVDQGVLIPGINDDYLDDGPDRGALELGEEPEWPDDDDDDDAADDDDSGDDDVGGAGDGGGCGCTTAPVQPVALIVSALLIFTLRLRRRIVPERHH